MRNASITLLGVVLCLLLHACSRSRNVIVGDGIYVDAPPAATWDGCLAALTSAGVTVVPIPGSESEARFTFKGKSMSVSHRNVKGEKLSYVVVFENIDDGDAELQEVLGLFKKELTQRHLVIKEPKTSEERAK